MSDLGEYWRSREQRSREIAAATSRPEIRSAHTRLADEYARRAAQVEAREQRAA